MKAVDRIRELNGNIYLLREHLKKLEGLDEQEINQIIIECLVDHEGE